MGLKKKGKCPKCNRGWYKCDDCGAAGCTDDDCERNNWRSQGWFAGGHRCVTCKKIKYFSD